MLLSGEKLWGDWSYKNSSSSSSLSLTSSSSPSPANEKDLKRKKRKKNYQVGLPSTVARARCPRVGYAWRADSPTFGSPDTTPNTAIARLPLQHFSILHGSHFSVLFCIFRERFYRVHYTLVYRETLIVSVMNFCKANYRRIQTVNALSSGLMNAPRLSSLAKPTMIAYQTDCSSQTPHANAFCFILFFVTATPTTYDFYFQYINCNLFKAI